LGAKATEEVLRDVLRGLLRRDATRFDQRAAFSGRARTYGSPRMKRAAGQ
jgi:hypothetical protein